MLMHISTLLIIIALFSRRRYKLGRLLNTLISSSSVGLHNVSRLFIIFLGN